MAQQAYNPFGYLRDVCSFVLPDVCGSSPAKNNQVNVMRFRINKIGILLIGAWCVFFFLRAEALAFDKKFSQALSHYIMAGVFENEGDLELATKEYKKAIRIDRNNPSFHFNLGMNYLKKNDVASAVQELNTTARLDPEAVEPHALLSAIYYSDNKIEDANRELEIALERASVREPKNISIYKTLGMMYLQQKRFKEAEKTYRSILALAPDDNEAHFYLGSVYSELGNNAGAIEELKQALQLKADYHEALNFLGYLYVEQNTNLQEAERLIKKAVELQPDNGAYIDSLGWLYFKKGRAKDALKELERAKDLLSDPVIYDHLGDVYFKLNDFKNAKTSWQESLKLDPRQKTVEEKLKQLPGNEQ
ncbi:MAG: tetratricopeptide repeat protein [Candidatus Omnitrophota bacterium]|nr:MAG: tetratricopeptide repeat protein [Candidatus Omnitrophota bacterium]